MKKTLRKRLGVWMIAKGIRLAGQQQTEVSKTDIKKAIGKPTSAVVEAPLEAKRWKEVQHGNVIVAEPDIMKQFRREREQM